LVERIAVNYRVVGSSPSSALRSRLTGKSAGS
jgi:hypothetical protein